MGANRDNSPYFTVYIVPPPFPEREREKRDGERKRERGTGGGIASMDWNIYSKAFSKNYSLLSPSKVDIR